MSNVGSARGCERQLLKTVQISNSLMLTQSANEPSSFGGGRATLCIARSIPPLLGGYAEPGGWLVINLRL